MIEFTCGDSEVFASCEEQSPGKVSSRSRAANDDRGQPHVNGRHELVWVPTDKRDWKPHERSMELGYLSDLVANI
jgi:hypothetical protein